MGSTFTDSHEAIAIVGIGCHMPGKVRSPSDLWKLLMEETIANTPKVPKSRFDIDAYLHANKDRPGSFNVSGGYFLDGDPEAFDPGLFGISPVEALWMEPQQRKLLEVVYEAFESSGTTLQQVSGQKIGCFAGCFTCDFWHMALKEPDFRHPYVATGVDMGILSNRISQVFNLKGPSLVINTACSSSLYALDVACKSILSGQCNGAVVGGTNLILTIDQQINTAKLGVLSPTNQCHTFDQAVDGYGRAEGVGALYIKRLSAAVAAGDPIRAVIRSTAAGCSGKPNGVMTHPSLDGQIEVLSMAHEQANLAAEDTFYVECHGTGTPVGDPIEVLAIDRALGVNRPSNAGPILIGSVKPNIGHSEAASSMGTLIKTILSLENGIIPPTAGISQLNKGIPWGQLNVRVVTEPTPFPASLPFRRIGVSAFGYGGTNAHCVLQDALSMVPGYLRHKTSTSTSLSRFTTDGVKKPSTKKTSHLLLFSAHDEPTLKNVLRDHMQFIFQRTNLMLDDMAYTLGVRRTKLSHRTFTIGRSDRTGNDTETGQADIYATPEEPARIAFVFTGQGAQWPLMGTQLMDEYPSVRQTMQKLDRHLSTLSRPPDWKIEELLAEPSEVSRAGLAEYSQPLCVAVQIALVQLLKRWGVVPRASVGHSSGEIAAAYAAGRISAEDAITAAYLRGVVVGRLEPNGAMLAVGLGTEESEAVIRKEGLEARVAVGCHNSPKSTTLSGELDAIAHLQGVLEADGVFNRVVKTDGKAYHYSDIMSKAAAIYEDYLSRETSVPAIGNMQSPIFSTAFASGLATLEAGGVPSSSYWAQNLRNPVFFEQGVRRMLNSMPDINLLVEIGPHPALAGPLRQICHTADRPDIVHLPSLKRHERDADGMLHLAGTLWSQDVPIDIAAVTSVEEFREDGSIRSQKGTLLVDLPPYHWTYSKGYSAESSLSRQHRTASEPRHDILGRKVLGTSTLGPTWRNILRQKDLPWLAQHRVGGQVLMPAAGYLALAIEALTRVNAQSAHPLPLESFTIKDVVLSSATVVPDDDTGTETLFSLHSLGNKQDNASSPMDLGMSQWYEFVSSCSTYGSWHETARGRICMNLRGRSVQRRPTELLPRHAKHIDFLDKLRTVGFDLGPAFDHIGSISTDGKTHIARGNIRISDRCDMMTGESRYLLHPTIIDACIQPSLLAVHRGHMNEIRCGTIPTHFKEVTVFCPSEDHLNNRGILQISASQLGNRSFVTDSHLIGHDGSLLMDLSGSRSLLYPAALPQGVESDPQRDLYIKYNWDLDTDYLAWAGDACILKDYALASMVDLFVHKDVKARIMCLDETLAHHLLELCPRLRSMPLEDTVATDITDGGGSHVLIDLTVAASASPAGGIAYDLIITRVIGRPKTEMFEQLREAIAEAGYLILVLSEACDTSLWEATLRDSEYFAPECLLQAGYLIIASVRSPVLTNGPQTTGKKDICIVRRNNKSNIEQLVTDLLKEHGWSISCQDIDGIDVEQVAGNPVLMLAEVDDPMLIDLGGEELDGLIRLTETASSIVWVTSGGLLTGNRPEFGMTEGVTRVIRNEQGSLDLVTLDYDPETTTLGRVADLISDILQRQHIHGRNGEVEYCIKNDAVYVARFVSHKSLNRTFVTDSGESRVMHQKDRPAVTAFLEQSSLIFQTDDQKVTECLEPGEIEVHVTAMGLVQPDVVDNVEFLNQQISGVVTRVGRNVDHGNISPGTTVFGFSLGNLATFQRVSSALVKPVPSTLSLLDAAALPSAFVTAIYALEHLARIEPGEYVAIIDSGAGSVGIAAVQLCLANGAIPIVIGASPKTYDYLVENSILSSYQITREHDGLSGKIKEITGGMGFGIMLYTASCDEVFITECIHHVADLGRVIRISLEGSTSHRHSYTPFETSGFALFNVVLTKLIKSRPLLVSQLLDRLYDLISEERVRVIDPIVSEITDDFQDIFRITSGDTSGGDRVLRYDESTSFKVMPRSPSYTFRGDAQYVLVGGFGGVGRIVAMWMAEKGAKNIAFLSRSGAGSTSTIETIESLERQGVRTIIARADILDKNGVARAMVSLNSIMPIRGVINAAGILQDGLFSNMKIGAWADVTKTKVKGSLNLHEAVRGMDLDFFVMTGSIASVTGSTGQGNYAAANSFLDALARHRHHRGLPGVCISLPAILGVGLLEDARYEQTVKSKGMYGIDRSEMIKAFEIAMTPQRHLPLDVNHIIVGMQPRRFGRSIADAGAHVPFDTNPTLSWLAASIEEQTNAEWTSPNTDGHHHQRSIRDQINRAPTPEDAVAAVAAHMVTRLARLLVMDEALIGTTKKSIASYGLDSMIGAEFRNWIFREFGIDMPFQKLLAGNLTITELARTVSQLCQE